MDTSLQRRGTLLLLLAVFHAVYGLQMLSLGPAGIQLPYFDGVPQFASIDASSIQYAQNTSSTILRIGGFFYLWREGAWFRGSSANGIYWKTAAVPPELVALQRRATE